MGRKKPKIISHKALKQDIRCTCTERDETKAFKMVRLQNEFVSAKFHISIIKALLLAGASPPLFTLLLHHLDDRIRKQDTWYRKALELGLKLAITLPHLVVGRNYHFRVASNTTSLIVREVCTAIIDKFAAEVLDCLTSPQEWHRVADQFADRWQMYHASSAMDGKHILIKCPKKSGSLFYNYKGFYSIILLALVDGDDKFLLVDVSQNRSSSDAQIFNQC